MKKLRQTISLVILSISILFSGTSFSANPIDTSIAPMLQNVLPAVVNIKAKVKITDPGMLSELQKQREKNLKSGGNGDIPDILASVASGVLVDAKNGYIITNAHVVADAQAVIVTLGDGRHYNAKMIGLDKQSDIALLQIKAKNLTAIPLGNSNDIKVGDFVAAIGNPFGLNQTVTSGIVSALGRTTLGIETYENFIQTDAPINPGNSGGALVNMKGELVGINTAILAPSRGSIGIGFAIPANMAKSVMLQLIEYGNVKRGLLGIGAQDITPELANAFDLSNTKGAAVAQVLPNSPAQQAGMQVGDIIRSINGVDVKSGSDVVNIIGFLRVDSKISMSILRNNKPLTLSVKLTDPKVRKEITEKIDPFLYGVSMKDFNVISPLHGNVEGALIVAVDQDSSAWHSDLRAGDIITSANKQKIKNVEELKLVSAKADKFLLINVIRGPGAAFLVINKEEA